MTYIYCIRTSRDSGSLDFHHLQLLASTSRELMDVAPRLQLLQLLRHQVAVELCGCWRLHQCEQDYVVHCCTLSHSFSFIFPYSPLALTPLFPLFAVYFAQRLRGFLFFCTKEIWSARHSLWRALARHRTHWQSMTQSGCKRLSMLSTSLDELI